MFKRFKGTQTVGDFLANLYNLRIYGDSLLTPRVKAKQVKFACLLTIVFILYGWGWSRAWYYGIGMMSLSILFGYMISFGELLYDRFVIVSDNTVEGRGKWVAAPRIVMVLLFSVVSSVPIELSVFEGEINNRIEQRERAAIDKIVEKAIRLETARFDDEMASLQSQLSRDASATSATASADVGNFENDRARERQQILEAQATKRTQLTQALNAKSDQVALEAAGKGPSGKYGDGPALKAMRQQEAEARAALDTFEVEAATQLANFDTDTQNRLNLLRAARDQVVLKGQGTVADRLDEKRAAKRAKVDEIRLLAMKDRPRLAGMYGESWEEARGFLARYRIMHELEKEDPVVTLIKWGCRFLMILPTLLILGIKQFPSEELVRYYSLGAQARAGNLDAQKIVANMGYPDFANYGLTTKVRDLLAQLYEARTELWMAAQQLERKLQKLCEPDKDTGVHKPLIDIEGKLHAEWLASEETVKKANLLEKQVNLTGIPVPVWEEDQFGRDPRAEPAIWKVSADRAETYGWHAPDVVVETGKQAREHLVLEQRQLRRLLGSADRDLHTIVSTNPRTPKRDLEANRRQFFNESLVPVLERIEEYEAQVQSAGLPRPPWPEGFEDPRRDLFKSFCRLDDRTLQDRYGWLGARGKSSSAPPAPAIPTPVVTPTQSSDGTSNTTLPEPAVTPESGVPTSTSDTEEPADKEETPIPTSEPAEAAPVDLSHMAEQLDPVSISGFVDTDKKKSDVSKGIPFDVDAWHKSIPKGVDPA